MSHTGKLSVERIVKIFDAAGIGQESRERFHRVFERDDPQGHEAFLAALNVTSADIARIRKNYAA